VSVVVSGPRSVSVSISVSVFVSVLVSVAFCLCLCLCEESFSRICNHTPVYDRNAEVDDRDTHTDTHTQTRLVPRLQDMVYILDL